MRSRFYTFLLCLAMGHSPVKSAVVEYEIDINYGKVNYTGKSVQAIKLNNSIPAPLIEAGVGDTLRVTFHNHLNTTSSIHWHGVLLPNDQDGVPFLTTQPIPAGGSFTFEYPVTHAGTYWYHSHTGLQEQRGVYGPLVFHESTSDLEKLPEVVLVWSDWIDEHPARVLANLKHDGDHYALKKDSVQSWLKVIQHGEQAIKQRLAGAWSRMGPMDISDIGYDAFLANGAREIIWPDFTPGETVRVRMINASASTYFQVAFSGGPMTIVQADGLPVEPVSVDQLRMAIAETYDVEIKIPQHGQHELRASANDGTGFASAFFGDGHRIHADDFPRPNLFLAGHAHGEHVQRHDGHANHSMHNNHAAMKIDAEPGGSHIADMPDSSISMPGHRHGHMDHAGPSSSVITMREYEALRARHNTRFQPTSEVREVNLRLTGDMERYVWSFNNKTLSEADSILIRKDEVARFKLENSTMMHHPIHLHGHFFRVLNGQGNRAPRKHTVNVAPMSTLTIEFLANAEKDWFFHCHNLYHMKAGMSRVVSYADSTGFDRKLRAFISADDHWYPSLDVGLFSNMGEGEAKVGNHRYDISLDFDSDYEEEYELEFEITRHIDRLLRVYAGMRAEREEDDLSFVSEQAATIGLEYLLPLLIEADLRLDANGQLELELSSELQLTDRGSLSWQWNTEDEYRGRIGYEFNKNFSLQAIYDSEFGGGIGVELMFW